MLRFVIMVRIVSTGLLWSDYGVVCSVLHPYYEYGMEWWDSFTVYIGGDVMMT